MDYPIRINKYLRDKGLASRREADFLIESGLVLVNGKRAQAGMKVSAGDSVELKRGAQKKLEYLAYYKPRGLATQAPKGEPSVIQEWAVKGLYPVGRLDKESEGLIILTNDGRVTAKLLGRESETEKEYVVKTVQPLREGIPAIFAKGMETKPLGKLLPAQARLMNRNTLRVILKEGKRHQIRVMLAELGYTIYSLKRIRVGAISIGTLKPGQTRALTQREQSTITSVSR